jgi:hypothetical protein
MQVEGVKAAIVNSCVFVICNYEDNERIYRSLLFRSMVRGGVSSKCVC